MLSIGDDTLDDVLGGGIPKRRSVLLTGGPGTGKSTLALQYLFDGIAKGENCLYISTEQTKREVIDAFSEFQFDFDATNLTLASIDVRPGNTLEDEEAYQLVTDDDRLGSFPIPFKSEYIETYVSKFEDVDRVAFDSVTALRPTVEDQLLYTRGVLNVIRAMNNEIGATTLLTGEHETGNGELELKYKAHGVIQLERRDLDGEDHFYLKVEKMRGVSHDRRTFEYEFVGEGLRVIPRISWRSYDERTENVQATGITGLDDLCGGGLATGGVNVLKTDGRAAIRSILTNSQIRAIEEGYAVLIVPPIELDPNRLLGILDRQVDDLDALIADNRLFILDCSRDRDPLFENHILLKRDERELSEIGDEVYEKIGDHPLHAVLHAHPLLEIFDCDELRRARSHVQAHLQRSRDLSLYVVNPRIVDNELAAFLEDSARQILSTSLHETGLQYATLEKSPSGYLGSSRLVEHLDEPPYISIQNPHSSVGSYH